jgi:hypothetical protein
MCECTKSRPERYCGRPGCRDPQVIEQERKQREAAEDDNQRQQREHGDDFGERTA